MKLSSRLIVGLVLVALIVIAYLLGLADYITLEQLKIHRIAFKQFVDTHYISSVFIFVSVYIIAIALCFPSASLITIAGGFLFGASLGTVYSVTGATIGALLSFTLVRYFFAKAMQRRYAQQMRTFSDMLAQDGISFLLFVRLVAIFPFFLINILISLTHIPLRTFAWTTALGIIPGTFVYAFAGKQLNTLKSVKDILSPQILLAFVLLGLLALLPVIIKRVRKR